MLFVLGALLVAYFTVRAAVFMDKLVIAEQQLNNFKD